jgi:hypothetical protein
MAQTFIDPWAFQKGMDYGERQRQAAQKFNEDMFDLQQSREQRDYNQAKQREIDQYAVPEKILSSQLNLAQTEEKMGGLQAEQTIRSAVENIVNADGQRVTLNAGDPNSINYIQQVAQQMRDRGDTRSANLLMTRELPQFALRAANATPDLSQRADILNKGGLIPPDVKILRNAGGGYDIQQGGTMVAQNVGGAVAEDWLTKAVDKVRPGLATSTLAGEVAQNKAELQQSQYNINLQRAALLKEQENKLQVETDRRTRINDLTLNAVDTLSNPNATPEEKKQAQTVLDSVRTMSMAEKGTVPKQEKTNMLQSLMAGQPTAAKPGLNLPPLPAGATPNVPKSIRQNNPLNLVDPKTGQIRTFDSLKEGSEAGLKDLQLKISGNSPAFKARFGVGPATPAKLAETWAPANAPGNSANQTANYAKTIAEGLGIGLNDPIPNTQGAVLRAAAAMAAFESGDKTFAPFGKPK